MHKTSSQNHRIHTLQNPDPCTLEQIHLFVSGRPKATLLQPALTPDNLRPQKPALHTTAGSPSEIARNPPP